MPGGQDRVWTNDRAGTPRRVDDLSELARRVGFRFLHDRIRACGQRLGGVLHLSVICWHTGTKAQCTKDRSERSRHGFVHDVLQKIIRP